MTAFVDESIRELGLGTYVLGCVIVPADKCPAVRKALGTRRFHFYREGPHRRAGMFDRIHKRGLVTAAYVLRGFSLSGQAGARDLCLKRLVQDLATWGEEELVIESREAHNDMRDEVSILSAQSAGIASKALVSRWDPGVLIAQTPETVRAYLENRWLPSRRRCAASSGPGTVRQLWRRFPSASAPRSTTTVQACRQRVH